MLPSILQHRFVIGTRPPAPTLTLTLTPTLNKVLKMGLPDAVVWNIGEANTLTLPLSLSLNLTSNPDPNL